MRQARHLPHGVVAVGAGGDELAGVRAGIAGDGVELAVAKVAEIDPLVGHAVPAVARLRDLAHLPEEVGQQN